MATIAYGHLEVRFDAYNSSTNRPSVSLDTIDRYYDMERAQQMWQMESGLEAAKPAAAQDYTN